MKTSNTPAAEKIIVVYEDGSTKELTKSAAFNFKEEKNGRITMSVDMVGMLGEDLEMIIDGILQLGYELGILDHIIESKREEANHASKAL